MTLIALTLNNIADASRGYPVMMADILISSPDGDYGMPTPTYLDGVKEIFSEPKHYKPLGLNQKLYIINDRLCVALGGNVVQMERFLNKLRVIYGDIDFNQADLWKFIDQFHKEEGPDLDAIVLAAKPNGEGGHDFQLRGIGALLQIDSPLYGNVVAGGSGAKQFTEFIQTNPQFFSDITNTDAFLASNQSLISHFLGLEISTGDTLAKYWGAGFEIITFEADKFIKLEEYTVVLIEADFGRTIVFEADPSRTMMINYQGDVMLITSFADGVERIFAVPALTEKRTNIQVNNFEPKHNTLLLSYIFKDADNSGKPYQRGMIFPRNKNQREQSPVVFKRLPNGRLEIAKDSRCDIQMLRTVLEELGYSLVLKDVSETAI